MKAKFAWYKEAEAAKWKQLAEAKEMLAWLKGIGSALALARIFLISNFFLLVNKTGAPTAGYIGMRE